MKHSSKWYILYLRVAPELSEEESEHLYNEALESYKQSIKNDPRSIEAYLEIARFLRDMESNVDSRPFANAPAKKQMLDFLLVARLYASSESIKKIDLNIIDALLRCEQGEDASLYVERLLKDQPTDAEVRSLAARLAMSMGDFDEAREHLEIALNDHDEHFNARYLYTEYLEGIGNYQQAVALLRELHYERKDNVRVRMRLAFSELQQGLLTTAKQRIERHLERKGDDSWADEFRQFLEHYDDSELVNHKIPIIVCTDEEQDRSEGHKYCATSDAIHYDVDWNDSEWICLMRPSIDGNSDSIDPNALVQLARPHAGVLFSGVVDTVEPSPLKAKCVLIKSNCARAFLPAPIEKVLEQVAGRVKTQYIPAAIV